MPVGSYSNKKRIEIFIIPVSSCFNNFLFLSVYFFEKRSVRFTWPEKFSRAVPYIFIIQCSFHEKVPVLILPKGFSHTCNAPVIICQFHCIGNRFGYFINWCITEIYIIFKTRSAGIFRDRRLRLFKGFLLHCFIYKFRIKIPVAFHVSVYDYWNKMIADH